MDHSKSVKSIRYNQAIVSFKMGKTVFLMTDRGGIPKFYSSHKKAMKAVEESRAMAIATQQDFMAALVGDVLMDFRVHYVQGFDQLAGSHQIRFGTYVRDGALTAVKVEGPAALIWHTTGLEARPRPKVPRNVHRSKTRSRRKSAALL